VLRFIPSCNGRIGYEDAETVCGEFKARVALEAPRGDKTLQEIAARHQVHQNQVSTWKRQAVDGFVVVRVIGAWIAFYNTERPHSALGGATPDGGLRLDHISPGDRPPLRAGPTETKRLHNDWKHGSIISNWDIS